MERHVYQDQDLLGSAQWFAYTSENGHVVANWGPFPSESAAYRAEQECPTCDHCGQPAPDQECPMCDRKCEWCGKTNYNCECPDIDEYDLEQEQEQESW